MKKASLQRLHTLIRLHLHSEKDTAAVVAGRPTVPGTSERREAVPTQGCYKEDLGSDGNVLLLNCGGNYMTLCVLKLKTIRPPKKESILLHVNLNIF